MQRLGLVYDHEQDNDQEMTSVRNEKTAKLIVIPSFIKAGSHTKTL